MERYDRDRGFGRGGWRDRYGSDFRRHFEGRWTGIRSGAEDWHRGQGGAGYDRGLYGEWHPGFGGYPGGRQRGQYYGGGARDELARRYGFEFGSERGWQQGGGGGGPRGAGGYPRPGGAGSERYDVGFGGGYGGGYGGGGGFGGGGYYGGGSGGGGGYGARFGGGYDAGFADAPFMPEDAYQRHPEYDRPQRHLEDRWPAAAAGGQGGYEPVDDEDIEQAVRQNLFQDNWIDAERIEVEVDDGVVTLKGEVDDFLEARYAWDDAWETGGVRGVINHIHVRVDGPAGAHDSMVQNTGKGSAKKGAGGAGKPAK